MKIVSTGSGLNSPGFYEKRRKERRIRLILALILLVAILVAFVYFSRQERFIISEVVVTGEEVAGRDDIVRTTSSLIAGHYLWIIPRANVFLYPRGTIKQSLLEIPRFKSVDLNLEDQTLLVSVEERIPSALYCMNTSECYFLDEEGYIFALAPSFSGTVYLVYTTEDPIENPIGQSLLASEEFKSLSSFIKSLETLNVHPVKFEIRDDEYAIFLSGGGQIMWRRESDLNVIYSNLEAFLSDETIKSQTNFLDKILQLDLRTDNKVFYKFKN